MKKFIILLATLTFSLAHYSAALASDQHCRMPGGFLDNGIGGTGLRDPGGDDDKGIGGTGAKYESAMVSGTIYAFGSICVNGLRIAYDDKTHILQSGQERPASALRIGQTVGVEADNENGLRARAISLHHEIEGPVTFAGPRGEYIRIMGTSVHIVNGIDSGRVKIGARLSVSGARDAEGKIVASLLAPQERLERDSIRGLLQKGADGNLYIDQTRIVVSGENMTAAGLGSVVEAIGAWDGAALNDARISRLSNVRKAVGSHTYFSYEGYLESVGPGNMVRMDGVSMKAKDLLCGGEPLKIGERLIAMGSMGPFGRILINGFVDVETPATRLSPEQPEPQQDIP